MPELQPDFIGPVDLPTPRWEEGEEEGVASDCLLPERKPGGTPGGARQYRLVAAPEVQHCTVQRLFDTGRHANQTAFHWLPQVPTGRLVGATGALPQGKGRGCDH